jgi:hypothetical protein
MMSTSPSIPTFPPEFQLGLGYWATVPTYRTADLLRHHLRRALQVVSEYQLPIPAARDRFELVVKSAAEAEMHYFNAAVYEPSQDDLDGSLLLFSQALTSACSRLTSIGEPDRKSSRPGLTKQFRRTRPLGLWRFRFGEFS